MDRKRAVLLIGGVILFIIGIPLDVAGIGELLQLVATAMILAALALKG